MQRPSRRGLLSLLHARVPAVWLAAVALAGVSLHLAAARASAGVALLPALAAACAPCTACAPPAAAVCAPCAAASASASAACAACAAPAAVGGTAWDAPPSALARGPTLQLGSLEAVLAALETPGGGGGSGSSGSRGLAVLALTSGNRAMNALLRNWAAAARALEPPLAQLAAPLDRQGLAELAAAGGVNLYADEAALARFGPGSSYYGDGDYAEMSAYKWALAAQLLARGARVLLADPDVVLLRNPVPYIATLPRCDVYMQMDVDWVTTGAEVRRRNSWQNVGYPNFFCGGFALLEPTNETR